MTGFPEKDLALLGQVGGTDVSGTCQWLMLRRNGHVLLCLPDSSRFRNGLDLYQPQSLSAKLALNFLKSGGLVARRLFPFSRQNWGGGGFLEWLTAQGELPVSVLLGNPSQKERRAIVLSEEDGEMRVWKVGFSEAGQEAIRLEFAKISQLPGDLPGLPSHSSLHELKEGVAFSMPFFSGESASSKDLPRVVELLRSWLVKGESSKSALDFSALSSLDLELRSQLEGLRLKGTLRHGDFAPWNVLKCSENAFKVIDWEMAEPRDGVPGWDLVHFLLQEARLVKKLSDENSAAWVVKALENPEVSSFLEDSGWGRSRHLLVLSYLTHCDESGSFDFTRIRKFVRKQMKAK